MSQRRARRRRVGGRVTTVALVLAAVAVVTGVSGVGAALLAPSQGPTATGVDMRGEPVELDPGVTPVSPEASHAVPDTGARVRVPAVGLDVPLGALDEVRGEITPPGFTSAYRVRNRGVPVADGATGTVYVVMHALRGGAVGPGNYLTDIDTGTATVHAGQEVIVAGREYTITGWRTVRKSRLATEGDLWDDTPGRLVLITCLELPGGGPSRDNMVVTATRS